MNHVEIVYSLRDEASKILAVIRALEDLYGPVAPAGEGTTNATQPAITAKPAAGMGKRRFALRVPGDPKTRTEKACNACRVVKPITAFPVNKSCADGHTGTCKACVADRVSKRRSAKKEQKNGKTAPLTSLDGKYRCEDCHAVFMGAIQLREHRQLRHSA